MVLRQKNRLKILIHQPRLSYYIGGGEIIPLMQARALSSFGHKVEILTSYGPKFSQIFKNFCQENPQIKIYYLSLPKKDQKIYHEQPGERWSRWDKESIAFGQEAVPFYLNHQNNWDLVITHLLSDSLYIPKSFKNILHLHGVPSRPRKWDNFLLKRPDGFIAVAKFVKNGWQRFYPILQKEKIAICYNGIDTQKFPDLNLEKKIDLLFVGRLLKNKGLGTILTALHYLLDQKVNFNHLVIVGTGPEKQRIKKQIKRLNLAKKIKLLDTVSQNQLVKLYNQSKIFLCPSTSKEGVLTTMLEAASCRATIITTKCCGMVEFAKQNTTALLIKPFDYKDLAHKIKLLINNDIRREQIAKKAKKVVRQQWDIKQTSKKLEKIYLNFLKK